MLTTRRKFASARRFFASWSPSSIRFASSISSSAESSGTLPISFKYIRTGSSMDTPSGTERSIFSTSISSSSSTSSRMSSSASSSVILKTSILFASRKSRIFSNLSESSCISAKKSLISWYSNIFFFFFARLNSSFNFSWNFSLAASASALFTADASAFFPETFVFSLFSFFFVAILFHPLRFSTILSLINGNMHFL